MTIILEVKVTPNASQNQMVSWEEGVLRLRIRGVPEKGEVNEELIAFLADEFGIAKSRIQIVYGASSRLKRLKIADVTYAHLNEVFMRHGVTG